MKFSWNWKAWYVSVLIGAMLLFVYIHSLLNYDSIIELVRDNELVGQAYLYKNLLYLLHLLGGKGFAIIALGILNLVPFVVALYKWRKRK